MKKATIETLVTVLLSLLSPVALKTLADSILDMIEDAIKDSGTDIDDIIVNPLIKIIREAFDIMDNDDPKTAA